MPSTMITACGWAALAGGVMWATKGVAILVTGDQPPLLLELPLALFPLGLLGLHSRLHGEGGQLRAAGRVVSLVALGAGAVAATTFILDHDADGLLPGLAIATSALGTVVGLVLLGLVARRTTAFPAPWHRLPLLMGIATPVLLTGVGGILAAIDERLLELPLVLLAVAWIRLGWLIAAVPSPVSTPTPASRSA